MPLQNQDIPKKFFALSNFLINPTPKTAEELGNYGFKTIAVKEKDQIYEPTKNPLIIIEGEEYKTYHELEYLISKEPNAEHLSKREIDDILSNFVSDILKDTENFKDQGNLSKKIDETISEILQPFSDWSVISPISGLTLPTDSFSIGTSIIKKFEESDKQQYFAETNEPFDKLFTEKFVEETCVVVTVKSNNKNSAIEKGRKKIQLVLNSIRTGMGSRFFVKLKIHYLLYQVKTRQKKAC